MVSENFSSPQYSIVGGRMPEGVFVYFVLWVKKFY